jgi:hypothetical protein
MAAVAAGSGYDARSLPFASPAGTWSAGQWGQYPSCYPSNGLQDTLATQQDLNNGMYLTGFQNAVSAQALGQVPPRRKCGRPKAPNPLDDPNIPEKKARRQVSTEARFNSTATLMCLESTSLVTSTCCSMLLLLCCILHACWRSPALLLSQRPASCSAFPTCCG